MPSRVREFPAPVADGVNDLHVTVDDDGGTCTARIALVGDLDMVVEKQLVERLIDVLRDARPDRAVLDLTAVPFLDSSGLRGLLRCARAAEDHGVLLTLAVVPGPVTMLLDTAGVRNWFSYE